MDDDADNSFSEYKRSVRGRATETMVELRRNLNRDRSVSPGQRTGGSPSASLRRSQHGYSGPARSPRSPRNRSPASRSRSPGWEVTRNVEQSDYTYGAAVDRLKGLLHKAESEGPAAKTVLFSPRSKTPPARMTSSYNYSVMNTEINTTTRVPYGPRGEVPSPEEVVPIIQNQSSLVAQLEAENKYCKDELHTLKLKVREVAEENRILHEELKRSVIQEILKEGIDVPGVPKGLDLTGMDTIDVTHTTRTMTKKDYGNWQRELERVQGLHAAKTSRLEAQVSHTKDEVTRLEQECSDLRSRLRASESMHVTEGGLSGLCVKCGQNEAILPSSLHTTQLHSIEQLTRERDEVMDSLTSLKARYEELKRREEDAYVQVKASVQMVEQAQLEQTQALIEREQLKEELLGMRDRIEAHVEEITRKLTEERELVRNENKMERDELNQKIKDLQEVLVETQSNLEKATRDKMEIMSQLGTMKGYIDSGEFDYSKATDTMKLSVTQAVVERNAAVEHMKKMRQDLDQMERFRDQERSKLKTESEHLRRRLMEAEKELVQTKEECIQLTNDMQNLEREAHMAKMAKQSIEKNRSDDTKTMQRRAEHRETELNMMLDTLENKHNKTVHEFEDIVCSQTSLINKLKDECRKLATQLENNTTQFKSDNKKLKASNKQYKMRLSKALYRLQELDDQHLAQGNLQHKMRERLKQLDGHAQSSSQQIIGLIAQESSLMRDRQLLAREVEFLRKQLATEQVNMDNLYSSASQIVNDILIKVRMEDQEKGRPPLTLDLDPNPISPTTTPRKVSPRKMEHAIDAEDDDVVEEELAALEDDEMLSDLDV